MKTIIAREHGTISTPAEEEYLNCIRCGLCLSVCPTYREYLNEAASPRGRVALARKNLEGEMALSQNLMEQMYACFACMACNEACPVGIHPADLALGMRFVQEQIQPSTWKNILFKTMLHKPEPLEVGTIPLRIYEKSGLRRLMYALHINKWLPKQLRDLEAMLPHLPQRPLRRVLPEISMPDVMSRYRVGFFLGCAQSLLFAGQSAASIRVMTRNACTVITPKETTCCGMPAKGYGRIDILREHAHQNIEVFEKANVDAIVTDCATCGATLKEYGDILAGEAGWADRAAAFSKKVYDVSEFLASIPLEEPQGRLEGRVTYHDPCHLRRAQGVWEQPRSLLKMIKGLEYIELPEADWCCGSAGSQIITHYETSMKVLKRKMDNVRSIEADYIASGCPGCQMQLNAGVNRFGVSSRVVHPIQLLDMAYEDQK
jgi:glycolate oxidase iron-sulfur subunit